jgi:hypothetical protein
VGRAANFAFRRQNALHGRINVQFDVAFPDEPGVRRSIRLFSLVLGNATDICSSVRALAA